MWRVACSLDMQPAQLNTMAPWLGAALEARSLPDENKEG